MSLIKFADLSIYLYGKSFKTTMGFTRFINSSIQVPNSKNLIFSYSNVNRGNKCSRFLYFGGRGLI